MRWLEVSIKPLPGMIDELCFFLENEGISGLVIEDGADFEDFLENNKKYWDYVDEELLNQKSSGSSVKFYLKDDDDGHKKYESLKERAAHIFREIFCRVIRDEDWQNNWMQYYKPIAVGGRLLILPAWEEVEDTANRLVIRLNPGLIFGTGSHPTTAMCLEELEIYAPECSRVLDLGCGSGILAIASLILGAKTAAGYDIDPKAPETAMSNALYNGITEHTLKVYSGDVLRDQKLRQKINSEKYDLITANIVADVIIDLAPDVSKWLKPGGIFICSGIIDDRRNEVSDALKRAGLTVKSHKTRQDWHCFTAELI